MNINRVNEEEIPYESLQEFGLTRNMIDDLPTDVLLQIEAGGRSPVLPVEVALENRHKVRAKAKFSLVKSADGKVEVFFHPVLKAMDDKVCIVKEDPSTGKTYIQAVDAGSLFPDNVWKGLKAGKCMKEDIPSKDGKKLPSYLWLDPETNEVITIPAETIGRNIQQIREGFKLNNAETHCIENGEPLTLSEDDDLFSVGIDMDSPTGIRFENGDDKLSYIDEDD